MPALKTFLGGVAVLAMSVHAATDFGDKTEMGPAAFMWPKDRVWSAAMDNTAPCGSVASVGDRSNFPTENGRVALVSQDESYDMELSISYSSDPKSSSDFTTLIDADTFRMMKVGHTCIPVPKAPSSVEPGNVATLQIKYIADFDKPENQTFYACADIRFVALADFEDSIPCFNSTKEPGEEGGSHADTGSLTTSSPSGVASASASASASAEKSKSGGLSGGAIAGIVVGAVAGVGLLLVAGFLLYRRRSRQQSIARRQQSSRGVNWEDQVPKDSQSGNSVRLNNL